MNKLTLSKRNRNTAAALACQLNSRLSEVGETPNKEELEKCLHLIDAPKSVRSLILSVTHPAKTKQGRKPRPHSNYIYAATYFIREGHLPEPSNDKDDRTNRGIRGCSKYVEEMSGDECSRAWVRKCIVDERFQKVVLSLIEQGFSSAENIEQIVESQLQLAGVDFTKK